MAVRIPRRGIEQQDALLGKVGTLLVLVAVAASLTSDHVSPRLVDRTLQAIFAEAGGLSSGDPVVVSGMAVGEVLDVRLRAIDVEVTFTVQENQLRLGQRTTAAIKARSALGKKALSLVPEGNGQLGDGSVIPLDRTTAPYDLSQALEGITHRTSELNTRRMAKAMRTVSRAFSGTPDSVRGAVRGLTRLSGTINARDAELRELLEHAKSTTRVLADHDRDLHALFVYGTKILRVLNGRKQDIEELLRNVTAVAAELRGIASDNRKQLGPALEQVRGVLTTLRKNRRNIARALTNAVPLLRSLGEVLSSMPTLDAYIANMPPTGMVPTVPQLLKRGGGR